MTNLSKEMNRTIASKTYNLSEIKILDEKIIADENTNDEIIGEIMLEIGKELFIKFNTEMREQAEEQRKEEEENNRNNRAEFSYGLRAAIMATESKWVNYDVEMIMVVSKPANNAVYCSYDGRQIYLSEGEGGGLYQSVTCKDEGEISHEFIAEIPGKGISSVARATSYIDKTPPTIEINSHNMLSYRNDGGIADRPFARKNYFNSTTGITPKDKEGGSGVKRPGTINIVNVNVGGSYKEEIFVLAKMFLDLDQLSYRGQYGLEDSGNAKIKVCYEDNAGNKTTGYLTVYFPRTYENSSYSVKSTSYNFYTE